MKITKEVEVKPVPARIETVTIYSCDFCDYETTHIPGGGLSQTITQCRLCKRYCCRSNKPLGRGEYHAELDPHEWGDYPEHYCPPCYRLRIEEYDHVFQEMEKEYERKEDALEKSIIEQSLKLKK